MKTFTVTIAADVRCYAEIIIEAKDRAEAHATALNWLREADGNGNVRLFKSRDGEIKGDIAVKVDGDEDKDDFEFEDVPDWQGVPDYSTLEARCNAMLAALKTAEKGIRVYNHADQAILDTVRAAIAEAEGRS
jgi:hypothetical protein